MEKSDLQNKDKEHVVPKEKEEKEENYDQKFVQEEEGMHDSSEQHQDSSVQESIAEEEETPKHPNDVLRFLLDNVIAENMTMEEFINAVKYALQNGLKSSKIEYPITIDPNNIDDFNVSCDLDSFNAIGNRTIFSKVSRNYMDITIGFAFERISSTNFFRLSLGIFKTDLFKGKIAFISIVVNQTQYQILKDKVRKISDIARKSIVADNKTSLNPNICYLDLFQGLKNHNKIGTSNLKQVEIGIYLEKFERLLKQFYLSKDKYKTLQNKEIIFSLTCIGAKQELFETVQIEEKRELKSCDLYSLESITNRLIDTSNLQKIIVDIAFNIEHVDKSKIILSGIRSGLTENESFPKYGLSFFSEGSYKVSSHSKKNLSKNGIDFLNSFSNKNQNNQSNIVVVVFENQENEANKNLNQNQEEVFVVKENQSLEKQDQLSLLQQQQQNNDSLLQNQNSFVDVVSNSSTVQQNKTNDESEVQQNQSIQQENSSVQQENSLIQENLNNTIHQLNTTGYPVLLNDKYYNSFKHLITGNNSNVFSATAMASPKHLLNSMDTIYQITSNPEHYNKLNTSFRVEFTTSNYYKLFSFPSIQILELIEKIKNEKRLPLVSNVYIVEKDLLMKWISGVTKIIKSSIDTDSNYFTIYNEMLTYYYCYFFTGNKLSHKNGKKMFLYNEMFNFNNKLILLPSGPENKSIKNLEAISLKSFFDDETFQQKMKQLFEILKNLLNSEKGMIDKLVCTGKILATVLKKMLFYKLYSNARGNMKDVHSQFTRLSRSNPFVSLLMREFFESNNLLTIKDIAFLKSCGIEISNKMSEKNTTVTVDQLLYSMFVLERQENNTLYNVVVEMKDSIISFLKKISNPNEKEQIFSFFRAIKVGFACQIFSNGSSVFCLESNIKSSTKNMFQNKKDLAQVIVGNDKICYRFNTVMKNFLPYDKNNRNYLIECLKIENKYLEFRNENFKEKEVPKTKLANEWIDLDNKEKEVYLEMDLEIKQLKPEQMGAKFNLKKNKKKVGFSIENISEKIEQEEVSLREQIKNKTIDKINLSKELEKKQREEELLESKEKEWEIAEVLQMNKTKDKKMYLIKWADTKYRDSYTTEGSLINSKQYVFKYHLKRWKRVMNQNQKRKYKNFEDYIKQEMAIFELTSEKIQKYKERYDDEI